MASRPLSPIAFHGSGVPIERFDYRFTNQGNDQNGSGFYFTSNPEDAIGYCTAAIEGRPKLGGDGSPTVHVARLHFDNLMDCEDDRALTMAATRLIMLASPVLDDVLWDFDDVGKVGRAAALNRAVPLYVTRKGDCPILKQLHKLANDFFPEPAHVEAFNRAVKRALRIDGIVEACPDRTHFVAFFPEQIEILARIPKSDLERDCSLIEAFTTDAAPATTRRPRRR